MFTNSRSAFDASVPVVSLDVDTRRAEGAAAVVRTASACSRLCSRDVLLKTVDSTLRGNVETEVSAALASSRRGLAVVAPAFPAQGRVTKDGLQFVGRRLLTDSEFAADGRHPPTTADLLDLIPDAVLRRKSGQALPSRGTVVCDAETDGDLDEIVSQGIRRTDVLWVGSPGLAAALARAVYGTDSPTQVPQVRRLAIVIGSQHPVNRRQLNYVQAMFGDRLEVVSQGAEPSAGASVVALIPETAPDCDSPRMVAAGLARRVGRLLEQGFGGAIVTGGETARAVFDELAVDGGELLAELAPGIGLISLGAANRVLLAAKAGGFGSDQTLADVAKLLLAERVAA